MTRVGEGPFPTEIHDEVGEELRAPWAGIRSRSLARLRRCGWLDLPLLRYSNRVNGAEWLVVTKLDVLDELAEIPVCTGYKIAGKAVDSIPADVRGLEAIQLHPAYRVFPGWRQSTEGIREFDQLPAGAKDYLRFLEDESGAKIGMVSTGPDRDQTITIAGFSAALEALHAVVAP